MAQVLIKHRGKSYFEKLSSEGTAGYTSMRNLQATLLWRWKNTKPHNPAWMTTPSRAYKTEKGVDVYRWSNCTETWRLESTIIWED